jgi:hypothetical protein
MKKYQLFSFTVSATLITSFSPIANAQNRVCPRSDYSFGIDGCLHRHLDAVLRGCREQRQICRGQPQPARPPVYTLTTPSQVTAAIVCDIAAAAKDTKGKRVDFSKAVISADITFSEVTKDSAGLSLAVAAIPVFSGASAAPSLDASRITSASASATTSITVDPARLVPCLHSSPNKWITSQVVTDPLQAPVVVKKVTEAVQFVVTKKGGAGLKLNIIPISIGPQFSIQNDKTQRLCLLFNFDPKKESDANKMAAQEQPKCQFGSGSGSGTSGTDGNQPEQP